MTDDPNRFSTKYLPVDINYVKADRDLIVTFDNGVVYKYPAEYLRVYSPSAEVQGHSPEQRKLVDGKSKIEIISIEPTGNYAIKLGFDDLHDTGIFSWQYLYKLGEEYDSRWAFYLAELDEAGKSRFATPSIK
ncbi:MAG: gamma-butyrobetaine hydroxylase-like domain-containing protein [Alphaproteobacteria bacterium]